MENTDNQSFEFIPLTESHICGIAQLASSVWNIKPDENYFRWKYGLNQGKPNGFGVLCNGKLVSASGYWHRPYFIAGNSTPATMLVDMMTHPDYRGKPYAKIAEEAKKLPLHGLFYGFTNEMSRRFYVQSLKRQNIKRFDIPLEKYTILYRFPNQAKRIKKLALQIFRPFMLSFQNIRIQLMKKASCRVERVYEIGPEFDKLWESVRSEYGVIGLRDSAYLKWRFLESPHEYQIWVIKEGNDIHGYMVTAIVSNSSGSRGLVVDWLISRKRNNDFKNLLAIAIEFLIKNKVNNIDTWIFNHEKEWAKQFRSLFFVRKPSKRIFLCFATDQIINGANLTDDMLFATMGDSDYPGPGRLED